MSVLPNLDVYVIECINNKIDNPILKKVITEEIIYCNNLKTIFKDYLSELAISINQEKLNFFSNFINDLSEDSKKIIKREIIDSFTSLPFDEQLYILLNICEDNKDFFKLMTSDQGITVILENISHNLNFLSHKEYIPKFIDACHVINFKTSIDIIIRYLSNDSDTILFDNKLIAFFLKKINSCDDYYYNLHDAKTKITKLIKIKAETTKQSIDNMKLSDMSVAFELFNLGKIIIDSEIGYTYSNQYNEIKFTNFINFSDEQLEYIVKSIHACMLNKNVKQGQAILAIIYFFSTNNWTKFMEYYCNYFKLRIKKSKDTDSLIKDEFDLWNINNQYKPITKQIVFDNYKRIINNISYSKYINQDLQKIVFNNSTNMNNVNVKLVNYDEINDENSYKTMFESNQINLHPVINTYILNLTKYFNIRSPLQYMIHDFKNSFITFATEFGTIKCPINMANILLHIKDGNKTIDELQLVTNIKKDDIMNKIKIFMMNNVIVELKEDTTIYYKFVEPFGEVECDDILINTTDKEETKISRFTDIIMTMDARIIKEVKPQKISKIELERRMQEFFGDEYIRNMFYQRLDSLKNRFFVKETDDNIEYVT